MKTCIDIFTKRAGLIEIAAKRVGEIVIGTERRGGITISSSFVCAVDHSGAIFFNSSEGYFFTSLGERIKILE